ncbi:MAG: phosphatase PAP2 family protein [Burkholderiales bacterium]|nr:phosphatase PAP2 family protein [Burkholderiales bacterium]
MSAITTLPPYGLLPNRFTATPLADLEPPRDYKSTPTPDQPLLRKDKNDFVDEFANDVKDRYWPIWDQPNRCWIGKSKAWMVAFTEADLDMLLPLRFTLRNFITLDGSNLAKTHSDCFELENALDPPAPEFNFGAFKFYAPDLDSRWQALFPSLFSEALDNKVGPLTIHWKSIFQRPRPYQTAVLLNRLQVSHRIAPSAQHPSLVSGHCMQGVFGGLGVHLLWRNKTTPDLRYAPHVQAALEQYSTDFGDRRVLAGVHYPSDSLISWLACDRLIDKVVEPSEAAEARKFLGACIRRSRVWAEVITHKPFNFDAYNELVKEVEQISKL